MSEVVIAGVAGSDDTALLVLREPQGVALTAVAPERITDTVLDDVWRNIGRLHDMRRTAASSLQDLGIRNEVVQAILNHAVPGVGGVYLRSELEKQKAAALAAWATALVRIVGPVRVTA